MPHNSGQSLLVGIHGVAPCCSHRKRGNWLSKNETSWRGEERVQIDQLPNHNGFLPARLSVSEKVAKIVTRRPLISDVRLVWVEGVSGIAQQ